MFGAYPSLQRAVTARHLCVRIKQSRNAPAVFVVCADCLNGCTERYHTGGRHKIGASIECTARFGK